MRQTIKLDDLQMSKSDQTLTENYQTLTENNQKIIKIGFSEFSVILPKTSQLTTVKAMSLGGFSFSGSLQN
jgi:predicted esterase